MGDMGIASGTQTPQGNHTSDSESDLSNVYTSAIIISLVCGAWTWIQLRHYARRDMPTPYFLVVFISWWLGTVGAATLLPLDIAVTSAGLQGDNAAMLKALWAVEYWVTFVLSWVVCPILMEYWAAGQFSVKAKLRHAIRSNLKLYSISAVVLLLLGTTIALTKGLKINQLAGFLLAAANCYGMLLIVVMIGYGLIELPRLVFIHSKSKLALQSLYFAAPLVEASSIDTEAELVSTIKQLAAFRVSAAQTSNTDAHFTECLATVIALVPPQFNDVLSSYISARVSVPLSLSSLADIHATLKRHLINHERATDTWHTLLSQADKLIPQQLLENIDEHDDRIGIQLPSRHSVSDSQQDMLHSTGNVELESTFGDGSILWHKRSRLLRGFKSAVGMSWAPKSWTFRGFVGIFLTTMSVVISVVLLWCECTVPFNGTLSVFGTLVSGAPTPIAVQMWSLVPMVYIAACAYTALFKFKLLDGLTLHSSQQTDTYCLLYNASYLGRLQFPLGINFVSMLFKSDVIETEFYKLVGNIDAAPFLGTSFNTYVPIFVILVSVLTYFRAMDRAMQMVGIEIHQLPDDSNASHRTRIAEGIVIVSRALTLRKRRQARQQEGGGSRNSTAEPHNIASSLLGGENSRSERLLAPHTTGDTGGINGSISNGSIGVAATVVGWFRHSTDALSRMGRGSRPNAMSFSRLDGDNHESNRSSIRG